MSHGQQDRTTQADKLVDSTFKGAGAVTTLLNPNAKTKDQNKALLTLGKGTAKAMFREASGATQVGPMLFTVLLAPFIAMFAVSSHLTYYDFGPKAYFFRRVAALVSPIWIFGMTAALPETQHGLLLIPALLPPVMVVAGYIYYSYMRRQYPASEPAWPGEVLLAKFLPDDWANGSKRPLLYIFVAPVTEYAIVLALGAILMPIGGVFIMVFGFFFMLLQMVGGMVGGAWQAHKNFVASEQLRAEAELAGDEPVDELAQDDAIYENEDEAVDWEKEEQLVAHMSEAIRFFQGERRKAYASLNTEDATEQRFIDSHYDQAAESTGLTSRYENAKWLVICHITLGKKEFPMWLGDVFTPAELERLYTSDVEWDGEGEDPLTAAEAKIKAMEAVISE